MRAPRPTSGLPTTEIAKAVEAPAAPILMEHLEACPRRRSNVPLADASRRGDHDQPPGSAHPIDLDTARLLSAALDELDARDDVRVGILTGTRDVFGRHGPQGVRRDGASGQSMNVVVASGSSGPRLIAAVRPGGPRGRLRDCFSLRPDRRGMQRVFGTGR